MSKVYLLLVLIITFSSCEIHKRKYRKGWHVEWAKGKSVPAGAEDKKETTIASSPSKKDEVADLPASRDTLRTATVSGTAPKASSEPDMLTLPKIVSQVRTSVRELKTESGFNAILEKHPASDKTGGDKKTRFPLLPLFFLIMAPLFILASGIAINNGTFLSAFLIFALAIAAFILALIFVCVSEKT